MSEPAWKAQLRAKEEHDAKLREEEAARRARKAAAAAAGEEFEETTHESHMLGLEGDGEVDPETAAKLAAIAAAAEAGGFTGSVEAQKQLKSVRPMVGSKVEPVRDESAFKTFEASREADEHAPKKGWSLGVVTKEEAIAKKREYQQHKQEVEESKAAYEEAEAAAAAAAAAKQAVLDARKATALTDRREADAHYRDEARTVAHLNELELAVCEAILDLRAAPSTFGPALLDQTRPKDKYDGTAFHLTPEDGLTVVLRTKEGYAAVEAARADLAATTDALPELAPSVGLTEAMYRAVRENGDRPNALSSIADYGKVSGSAKQLMFRGPYQSGADIVASMLVDDGNDARSRRGALLAPKWRHFGLAASITDDGRSVECWLLLAVGFVEKSA